jgi:hypothetical protein
MKDEMSAACADKRGERQEMGPQNPEQSQAKCHAPYKSKNTAGKKEIDEYAPYSIPDAAIRESKGICCTHDKRREDRGPRDAVIDYDQ